MNKLLTTLLFFSTFAFAAQGFAADVNPVQPANAHNRMIKAKAHVIKKHTHVAVQHHAAAPKKHDPTTNAK